MLVGKKVSIPKPKQLVTYIRCKIHISSITLYARCCFADTRVLVSDRDIVGRSSNLVAMVIPGQQDMLTALFPSTLRHGSSV